MGEWRGVWGVSDMPVAEQVGRYKAWVTTHPQLVGDLESCLRSSSAILLLILLPLLLLLLLLLLPQVALLPGGWLLPALHPPLRAPLLHCRARHLPT